MDGELSQDLILQSLPDSFSQFVINYHMSKLNISLPELLNMLKTAESHFKSEKASVLLVDKINKKKNKKGSKKKLNPKGWHLQKKGKEGLRQRYLLSLWQGGALEEKLQGIPCNCKTSKYC